MNFFQTYLEPRISKSSNPKIGIIALCTDFTIEQDFRKIFHNQDVDIFVNRIPFENPLNYENYLRMADHFSKIANDILPGEKIDSIAFGCTSGTVAIGEKRIINEIHKAKKGAYVSTPITAALRAFSALKISKVAVLAPYPKEVNESVFNYLTDNNVEITSFHSFNLDNDYDIANVDPNYLIEIINEIDHRDAHAIFISCTALRVVEVIDRLEQCASKFVLSSNQALIWDTMRSVNINNPINGYGKLFLN